MRCKQDQLYGLSNSMLVMFAYSARLHYQFFLARNVGYFTFNFLTWLKLWLMDVKFLYVTDFWLIVIII